jgi:hypothetical protein
MMGRKDDLYAAFAKGVRDRHKKVFDGHDAPYLHRLFSAVGCYLVGAYDEWKRDNFKDILAAREPDGSIWFANRENDPYERRTLGVNIASTAVLAILCNLDKGNLFQLPKKAATPEPKKPAKNPKPTK